ncbi:hypothetical protein E6H36_07740 [Candidatus Bathyarchaeota archaeon]|nr:MAG: hypothetical protein E6H36_07740 [Candidatus Bathyarchaeota archaeon]
MLQSSSSKTVSPPSVVLLQDIAKRLRQEGIKDADATTVRKTPGGACGRGTCSSKRVWRHLVRQSLSTDTAI